MKKKVTYGVLALIVVAFAFGSIFMPPSDGKYNSTPIAHDSGSKVISFTQGFHSVDYVIIALYAIFVVTVALLVSRKKGGEERSEEDYFLAGKTLPWWAIGSSLIAANISAEQFVGQSGSGFAIGLAIASYEWMAALTLIIVGKFFLPIFINQKIYTIPEFVEHRYNRTLKTILAIFWLALFVFVNLASVTYLGALAMQTIIGADKFPLWAGILILAFFAAAYSLYGGLSAVAWTDVIQVVVLVIGGIITTILALYNLSGGVGVFAGLGEIFKRAPDHLGMILDRDHPKFMDLPGIAVLLGGMWIANLYYWGFNQYIIQRTFAAKSLKEAQKGIGLAALIKLIIPFIVVIPGIAAYVMFEKGMIPSYPMQDGNPISDSAYPVLLNMLPTGLKGIAFAALIAAIISSMASMLNSIATIFAMDIYKPYIHKNATAKETVNVGRITAAVSLIVGGATGLLLGGIDQAFQFIQEWTGVVSPGILAIFLLGLFWKKTTTKAAIAGALCSLPIALLLKIPTKIMNTGDGYVLDLFGKTSGANPLFNFPWLNQMGITLLVTLLIVVIISLFQNKGADDKKGIATDGGLFKTSSNFNIIAYAVMILLVTFYVIFWNSSVVEKIFS